MIKTKKTGIKLIFCFFAAVSMLMGCASLNPTKLYEGPTLPESSVGRIIMDCSETSSCDVKIFKQTGNKNEKIYEHTFLKPHLWSWPLKVLPGKYTVQIEAGYFEHISGMIIREGIYQHYNIGTKYFGGAPCSVEFTIDAGKTFYVKVDVQELGKVTENDLNSAGEKGLIVKSVIDDKSYEYGYDIRGGRSISTKTKYKYNFFIVETTVIDRATMQRMVFSSFDSKGNVVTRDKESLFGEWDEKKWKKFHPYENKNRSGQPNQTVESKLKELNLTHPRGATNLKDPEILESLIRALGSHDYDVSGNAIDKLVQNKNSEIINRLIDIVNKKSTDENYMDTRNAVKALGQIGDTSAVQPLLNILADDKFSRPYWGGQVKKAAFVALAQIGDPSTTEFLILALKDYADYQTISALGKIQDEKVIKPLMDYLKSEDTSNSSVAVLSLGNFNRSDVIEALIGTLTDYYESVRINSAKSLGKIGSPRAIEPLILRLKYDNMDVRMAALHSLRTITGEKLSHNYNEWQDWWDRNKQKFEKDKQNEEY